MANEVTTLKPAELIPVLRSSLYPGASDASINLVIQYCQAAKLDIMQKPVHIVPQWNSKAGQMVDAIMPGIGLYRTQAARSGRYAGISEPEYGPMITDTIGGQKVTYPEWCRVTVKRLLEGGQIAEFTATEYWIENYAVKGGKEKSVAPNAMWAKRCRGQLAKCAQAQALRTAFPEATGSAPTAEEMEGRMVDSEFAGTTFDASGAVYQQAPEAPKSYPEADFIRNLPKWLEVIQSGRMTIEQIESKAKVKGAFTAEQRDQLLPKHAEQETVDVEYSEVTADDTAPGEFF